MAIERAISHIGTDVIIILRNIHIGEKKGMKENTLTTMPFGLTRFTILTRKPAIYRNVTGKILVLTSSILLTSEPTAP